MERPRFALRTALIVFTLLGAGLGFYRWHTIREAEHTLQIDLIEKARRLCKECDAYNNFQRLVPRKDYVCGEVYGRRLTVEAARALGEAHFIKDLIVYGDPTEECRAALERHFINDMTREDIRLWHRKRSGSTWP